MRKILVVDDDDSARLFLQRLLTKKFTCQVLEAKDGLQGLALLQKESPSLVIMDVRMPVIDGVEMLEAIRSDGVYAGLPVIVTSVVSDRAQVAKLIMLGISGYVLKPLWSEIVYRKVYDVLARTRSSEQGEFKVESDATQNDRGRILLVDKDLNFRTFFNTVLGGRFDVDDLETGVDAFMLYEQRRHQIVCLGQNLPLLNERLLARKIRQIDASQRSDIFLLTGFDRTTKEDPDLYHGVIKKSFVPDLFLRDFNRVVLNEESIYDTVLDLLDKRLPSELTTATQQTFGVISTQEIDVLPPGETDLVRREVCASVELFEEQQKFVISVGLVGSEDDVLKLAERILGTRVELSAGATDAFGELANTIGGRIRTSLQSRGVKLEQGTPVISHKGERMTEGPWKLAIPFRTDDGQHYLVGLNIDRASDAHSNE
jgi:CheY-like chemotaxis protein